MPSYCKNSCAQESPCTDNGFEAERSLDYLNSWEDIYQSFKKYKQCDDGALAEGYSDKIVHMLADHWDKLNELIRISSADKEFHDFVLRHIDATVNYSDLDKILINCKHCPESLRNICSEIEKAAKEALIESEDVNAKTQ
jgi:hypothetical protein